MKRSISLEWAKRLRNEQRGQKTPVASGERLLRILIPLASQQKGFFISMARKLSSMGHVVFFVPKDRDVKHLIQRLAPETPSENIRVEEEFHTRVPLKESVRRGLEVENRYNVRLSMLLSHDRALGRGYIFNADCYPQIRRARWSHERKTASILESFHKAEGMLEWSRPDLILALQKQVVLHTVAKARGIVYLSPTPVKLGHRFMWSDDFFITSTCLLQSLRENVGKSLHDLPTVEEYVQEAGSKYNHARISYSFWRAIKDASKLLFNESQKLLRGRRRKDSYRLFDWVSPVLRRPIAYRFFLRRGIHPGELAGKRAVYVPLHLEPEIALLDLSPEFNNSMEMIAWISKAAPADTLVVVKEQPFSFGVRSIRYYEQLSQIGNVALAHPATTSWEWIRAATATATITGTAATEAVMFRRPVLSFGKHQAVNLLPTVRFATDYESTGSALDDLFKLEPSDPFFELSRRALHAAQLDCSFDLPGFERIYKSNELQDGIAEIALDGLLVGHGHLFTGVTHDSFSS